MANTEATGAGVAPVASVLTDHGPEASVDPFTRPDLPPPFDTHSCPVCGNGKRPCTSKVVGNCGNLFARND